MSSFDVALQGKSLEFLPQGKAVGREKRAADDSTTHTPHGSRASSSSMLTQFHSLPLRTMAIGVAALAYGAWTTIQAWDQTPTPASALAARAVLVLQTSVVFGLVHGGFRSSVLFLAALTELELGQRMPSIVTYIAACVIICDTASDAQAGYGRVAVGALAIAAVATCAILRTVVEVDNMLPEAGLIVVLFCAHASLTNDYHWANRLKSSCMVFSRSRT